MNHFSCCLALSLTMSTRCACLSVRFGVCCVCYIPNRVISSRRLSHTIFQRICRLKIRFAANQSSVFTSNPVFSCIPFLSVVLDISFASFVYSPRRACFTTEYSIIDCRCSFVNAPFSARKIFAGTKQPFDATHSTHSKIFDGSPC